METEEEGRKTRNGLKGYTVKDGELIGKECQQKSNDIIGRRGNTFWAIT